MDRQRVRQLVQRASTLVFGARRTAHPCFRRSISTSFPDDLKLLRAKIRELGAGNVELDLKYAPGIALVTLRNQEKRNALSPKMMAELADVVDSLEVASTATDDSSLVGVILHGEGQTFCSGFDLSVARSHFLTPEAGKAMTHIMNHTLGRWKKLPLISVAAVEGFALGGGAELAVSCDHRVMSKAAIIRFVQVKMGVVTGWGGGHRLTGLLPRNHALRILGSAPKLAADEAHKLGLADAVCPGGSTLKASEEFLNAYITDSHDGAAYVPAAVRGMKRIVSQMDDDHGRAVVEKDLFCGLWGSPANLEALNKARRKK